jgi:vacuolar-type H+-ATPase subunit H
MFDTVTECEREVEFARAKLKRDFGTLRSPAIFSSFTDELKAQVLEVKDARIENAKEAVRTRAEGFVEDVKARAAANPAAALAIGAGIAWQLIRHPPITTLLIGAGVLSLWRTTPHVDGHHENADYLALGKQRLKQQINDLGVEASKVAGDAGHVIAEKTGQASNAAVATAQDWSREAAQTIADLTSRATAKAQGALSSAREVVSDAGEQASLIATDATRRARSLTRDTAASLRDTATTDLFRTADRRDKLLLGAAGLAVAGAIGIALQKRVAAERSLAGTER